MRELSERIGDLIFDYFPLLLAGMVVTLVGALLWAAANSSSPCEEGFTYDLGTPIYINNVPHYTNARCVPEWSQ